MNVPTNILGDLKCSNCKDLLSCGPVKQKHNGSNICGRCSDLKLEEPMVLNQPYNSLAELCAFPCKYEAQGCTERALFKDMSRHEADCEYRTYICPVLQSGRCEWIGPRNQLLQHVQDEHPEHVLPHPAQMDTDVRAPSHNTFLMAAYNVLFLLHVKVCLATHTIYHSVRKLGGMYDFEDHTFKFFVKIENDNRNITRKRDVAPQGFVVLQEDSAIGIKTNTMLEVLGGYNNTKFVISIEEYMKCVECKKIVNSNDIEYCKFSTYTKRFYYCKQCTFTLASCMNASEGCTWKGQNDNHGLICRYTKKCTLCNDNMSINTLPYHIQQKHSKTYFQGEFLTIFKNTPRLIPFSFKNHSYALYHIGSNSFFVHADCDQNKIQCILIIRNIHNEKTSHYLMNASNSLNVGQCLFSFNFNDDDPFLNAYKFEVRVDIHSYE